MCLLASAHWKLRLCRMLSCERVIGKRCRCSNVSRKRTRCYAVPTAPTAPVPAPPQMTCVFLATTHRSRMQSARRLRCICTCAVLLHHARYNRPCVVLCVNNRSRLSRKQRRLSCGLHKRTLLPSPTRPSTSTHSSSTTSGRRFLATRHGSHRPMQ